MLILGVLLAALVQYEIKNLDLQSFPTNEKNYLIHMNNYK